MTTALRNDYAGGACWFPANLVIILGSLVFLSTAQAHAAMLVPAQAKAVGYKEITFSSNLNNQSFDIAGTRKEGSQWYLWSFFDKNAKSSELKFNHNHTLTLLGGHTGPNGEIATAASVDGSGRFAGIAFGGGAYFESEIKFNPEDVRNANFVGHPSFWSIALEHLVGYGSTKESPGAERFGHFIEADIFEYDLLRYLSIQNVYGGAIHDWYGVWKKTCLRGFCNFTTPSIKKWIPKGTDLNQFHRYGFLWVPATPMNSGYAQYYFDDAPVGDRISWKICDVGSNPGNSGYSAYCIIDHQHLVLILGTGVGEPMTVRSIKVFQHSIANNLIH